MCDLSKGDNRQREATVKNGQKSTHLTNPSTNWNSACSASPLEIRLALTPLRTRHVDVIL
jgi:hypothetical protein